MNIDKTVELAMDLIARPSVTPNDAGCQDLLIKRLAASGFQAHRLRFGDVDNFWAERGHGSPLVVFAGHTDVVPPGAPDTWQSDPFDPEIRDGYLYGRGAADMKSSLAAFVIAIENYIARYPQHRGSIALLITSDEEGVARDGTAKVVKWLTARGKKIDYCIVGEPSSVETLGDVIKIGRRGSLNGRLSVHGVQGHIAYPQRAKNPIHVMAPALAELVATEWDQGYQNFPKTTFQVSNIHAGTGADNVIPGKLEIEFNFRYSPAVSEAELRKRVEDILGQHNVEYSLAWRPSGQPFLTSPGTLVDAVHNTIRTELEVEPQLSTAGGTSDARFIAPTGAEVIELGPLNGTIHQANESVPVQDLPRLADVYTGILQRLLAEK